VSNSHRSRSRDDGHCRIQKLGANERFRVENLNEQKYLSNEAIWRCFGADSVDKLRYGKLYRRFDRTEREDFEDLCFFLADTAYTDLQNLANIH
jgi:hypothetical protein